jgi:large subunit ribosomal protein L25
MTTAKFEFTAQTRDAAGRGACGRLRREEKLPGIVYGAGKDPQKIVLDHIAFAKSLENEAVFSHILTLDVDGKKEKVVLKDLQRHTFKPKFTHVDFMRINENEKLTMHVPLHFIGEEVAPGVKLGSGVLSHHLTEVEVRCLPADLPEFIEVDVSQMQLNDVLHLSNLKLPKGVEHAGKIDEAHDQPVISLHLPRVVEEVPVAAPEAPIEVPATAQAPAAEAAEGAKGGEGKGAAKS